MANLTFPVIDLGLVKENRALVIQQIMKACDDYDGFQVINHGVPKEVMDEAMLVSQEFFDLPDEEKAKYAKEIEKYAAKGASFYSKGTQFYGGGLWRDFLKLPTNAGGDDENTWPENPSKYREVIRSYSDEVGKLSKVILGLISEGLGLEPGFFDKELVQAMLSNHYPACPDPDSALALNGHCDPNLITLIQQKVYGLQILKDGNWIGVEPLPHAFVINLGLSLTVISNGKIASTKHQVVTNPRQARLSLGTFINPEEFVEPAKSLVGPTNPIVYKRFHLVEEFMPHFLIKRAGYDEALDLFKIHA